LFGVQKAEAPESDLYRTVMDWCQFASPVAKAMVAKAITEAEAAIAAMTKQQIALMEKVEQVTEATVRRAFDHKYRSYDGVHMDVDGPYVVEVSISPLFVVVSEDGRYGKLPFTIEDGVVTFLEEEGTKVTQQWVENRRRSTIDDPPLNDDLHPSMRFPDSGDGREVSETSDEDREDMTPDHLKPAQERRAASRKVGPRIDGKQVAPHKKSGTLIDGKRFGSRRKGPRIT